MSKRKRTAQTNSKGETLFLVSDEVTYERTWRVWALNANEAREKVDNSDTSEIDYTEEELDSTDYEVRPA
jgi:hypothetical protein